MSLKIVIIGAGEVGFNLAKELSQEDHDITLIDNNADKIRRAGETLDVNTLEGDGASPFVLRSAQVDEADMFMALTLLDEVNLVASQMARKLGAATVIARLRNTEYTSAKAIIEPAQFGIDHVIHPELAAVEEIERLLRQSSAMDVKEFADGRLQLIGVRLESSSPLLDRTVREVSAARNAAPHLVIAFDRGGEHFSPGRDIRYQAGDIVYVLGETRHASNIVTMLGKPPKEVKRIMILGAGKIGRQTARRLQSDLDIKLVDANKSKAWDIAPTLEDTLVLHGDGTDIDFLVSENIDEMDSFIAVTQDEKTNLLTGLLAKQLGAQHVIVHLATASYLPIARRIGIDAAVSKNMATVEAILRVIKSSRERSVSSFEDLQLDAVEIAASEGSKITSKPIRDVGLPAGAILGAIMRNDKIEIPGGDSRILAGDRVIVFAQDDEVEKVQKYFR